MPILKKFDKQPVEVQDYDIDFAVRYLAGLNDTAPGPSGLTVTADPGITIDSFLLVDGKVKVWVSGGTTDTDYKITATVVTTGGRKKQAEIVIKVKDY